MKDFHRDDLKYKETRISGPYGPFKILAPAGGLLASLTRGLASLAESSPNLKGFFIYSSTYDFCDADQHQNVSFCVCYVT